MYSRDLSLTLETKQVILKSLFNYDVDFQNLRNDSSIYDSFFEYYRHVIESCSSDGLIHTHEDVKALIGTLKGQNATRQSIDVQLQALISKSGSGNHDDIAEIIEEAVDIAARLLVMMPTSLFPRSVISGGTILKWRTGTVTELVAAELSPQIRIKEHIKLEKAFNARNLERIGGIEIRWTCNLADHLRMRDDDKAVEIFHYASFMRLHQNCHIPFDDLDIENIAQKRSPILDPKLIEETLQTLALLFPEYDRDVEMWFQKKHVDNQKRRKLPLDLLARECGQLKAEERQIDNFVFWHDRIVMLKQAYDEAEPSGVMQWWHDRRKKVQWYTFWVAALVLGLTIFFGLVQCIEGGIQVYYAAHS